MGSSGGAILVPKILLKTGIEVIAIITNPDKNKTKDPTNIQNSLLEISSSLIGSFKCLYRMPNKIK